MTLKLSNCNRYSIMAVRREILLEASDRYEIAGIIPCSAAEARRKTPSVADMMRKHPTDRWLSPYEPEVTRSKRVGGI